jgi:hypothetical protein
MPVTANEDVEDPDTEQLLAEIRQLAWLGRIDDIPETVASWTRNRRMPRDLRASIEAAVPGVVLNHYLLALPDFVEFFPRFEEVNPNWTDEIVKAVRGKHLQQTVDDLLTRAGYDDAAAC